MSESSAAIGLASASSGLPPPNNSASRFDTNDQVTASTMARAASARLALRVRFWIGVSTALRALLPRGNGVDGTWSTPTMRTSSSTISARPCTSGRHDGTATFTRLALAGGEEAELLQHAAHLGRRQLDAGKPRQFAQGEIDDRFFRRRIAGDHDLRRRAAAEIEHHLRRELETGQHEIRIDAALETITRIGIDAELAAGLRDVERVPQRRFDQHVGGRLRAAGGFAAHDAGKRFDALLVGDDAHAVVERVGLAVEGEQRLAALRAPHGEIAVDLGGVEHMQRAAAVEGDEVGDVDQRVDRPQADGGEPLLQPVGRGAVLDALAPGAGRRPGTVPALRS